SHTARSEPLSSSLYLINDRRTPGIPQNAALAGLAHRLLSPLPQAALFKPRERKVSVVFFPSISKSVAPSSSRGRNLGAKSITARETARKELASVIFFPSQRER